MDWFRMYSEARNDAKIRSLSDKEHRVWFNLLCFANEQDARGSINGYETELLAVEVADGDIELLDQTINRLAKLRILQVSEDGIEFINFKKRNYDNQSDLPDSTRDRKRKQREREKQCHDVSRDVTTSHDTYTETDTDTDTDINNNTCSPDGDLIDKKPVEKYADEFEELWSWYPRKTEKKAAYACWKARKKAGHLARDMLEAVKVYAQECAGKEERYIKHAKTFLGPNTPFVDCLNGGKVVNISGRYDKYEQDVYRG